jgi:histidinol-phosphatase (PHP family)
VIPDNHNHYLMAGGIDVMLAAAARERLDEIAVTEHNFHIVEQLELAPYLRRWEPEGGPITHAEYVETVRGAAHDASLVVRLGIELDVRADDPELERGTQAFRDAYGADWDLVLGSVHVIRDDVPVQDVEIAFPAADAWEDYLQRVGTAAASGRYDVVTHPVRLGFSIPGMPSAVPSLLDRVARTAAYEGVALEVNGSDLRHRPDLVQELITACARHRTPVSCGSDAHLPGSVGCIRDALPLLRAAGITHVARFEHRRRELVPI